MADESTTTEPSETAGGAVEETQETTEAATATGEADEGSQLGDAGKAAIAKERKRAAEAEKALREARRQAKENADAAAELAKLKKAQQTDQERLQADLDAAVQRSKALAQRAVRAEVRSLASSYEDPTDAEVHLDLGSYLGGDGEIDTEQIKQDLAALLERKPHLAKKAPEPEKRRAPAPDRTQASSANASRTSTPEELFGAFLKAQLK